MNHAHMLLGKYAILQYDISAQLAEHRQTQSQKRTFFGRRLTGAIQPDSKKLSLHSTETQKLAGLTGGSSENLFVAKTVFPFVLFTDTIKIDRQKATIVHNDLLWQSQTSSTEIKNIMNVEADMGPLLGSITITSKHFRNNTQIIRCLKRNDVTTIQRLLQGFMIAQRAKINTDNIDKNQLLTLLNELGQENRL